MVDRRHQYDYEERLEVLPSVPTDARSVLDVGCSRGGFGAALRGSGLQAKFWGIDADLSVAGQASGNYDRFFVGVFPEVLDGLDERFDCIVFNDVLEHMADPWEALRAAGTYLSPTGTVVASIPNVRYLPVVGRLLLAGDFTYTVNGVMDHTHMRFFTKKTMRALFEATGYEVTELRGIAPWRGRRWLAALAPPGFDDAVYRQFVVCGRRP